MTFVDIGDEDFIIAESVVRVKKIDDGKCSLWMKGQSALEGFVIERNARELIDEIIDAILEVETPEDEEDEDDQDEE